MSIHKLYEEQERSIRELINQINYLPKVSDIDIDDTLRDGISGTIFLLQSVKDAQLMRLNCYDKLMLILPEVMKLSYTLETEQTVDINMQSTYKQYKESLDELTYLLADIEQIEADTLERAIIPIINTLKGTE